MKLLKLTLITLLLNFTTTIKAQDASNDATWEETIDFLTDFLPNFNNTKNENSYTFNLKNKVIQSEIIYKSSNCSVKNQANLNQIASVGVNSEFIYVKFIGNSVSKISQCSHSEGKINSSFGDVFLINISNNSNLNKRLQKALRHLAYLAKEKRKKSKF